jgi:hypothetical protein
MLASSPPSHTPPRVKVQKARMVCSHVSSNDKELSFVAGDVILVKNVLKTGWGIGELKGAVGMFPLHYAEMMEVDFDAEEQEEFDLKVRRRVTPMIAKLQMQCGFFEEKRNANEQKQMALNATIASLQETINQTRSRREDGDLDNSLPSSSGVIGDISVESNSASSPKAKKRKKRKDDNGKEKGKNKDKMGTNSEAESASLIALPEKSSRKRHKKKEESDFSDPRKESESISRVIEKYEAMLKAKEDELIDLKKNHDLEILRHRERETSFSSLELEAAVLRKEVLSLNAQVESTKEQAKRKEKEYQKKKKTLNEKLIKLEQDRLDVAHKTSSLTFELNAALESQKRAEEEKMRLEEKLQESESKRRDEQSDSEKLHQEVGELKKHLQISEEEKRIIRSEGEKSKEEIKSLTLQLTEQKSGYEALNKRFENASQRLADTQKDLETTRSSASHTKSKKVTLHQYFYSTTDSDISRLILYKRKFKLCDLNEMHCGMRVKISAMRSASFERNWVVFMVA